MRKNRFGLTSLFLSAILMVSACDRVEINFFQLGEFRILALVADPPEVKGNTVSAVSVTPWISDIDAQGRTINVSISACPDPGIGLGAEPACLPESPATQTITYASFDTQTLSNTQYTGAMPSFDVTVPNNLLDGLSAEQRFNGIDYLVVMEITLDERVERAFKRILVSDRDSNELNNNPRITELLINGEIGGELTDGATIDYRLDANESRSTYDEFGSDGNLRQLEEAFLMTWFVSGGQLSFARTEPGLSNVFTSSEGQSSAVLVGVLRDGRGGLDVQFVFND